jgi:purine-binding chemotaxis protein CheW
MIARATAPAGTATLVTFRVAAQWLGLPVAAVQEVLTAQQLAPVPLAPPETAGLLNLRGQIVTAVELRVALGEPPRAPGDERYDIVVRDDDELFALAADAVGDVIAVEPDRFEPLPTTLGPRWTAACTAAVRRDDDVLLVLDLGRVLSATA